jgi:hypothetical protein
MTRELDAAIARLDDYVRGRVGEDDDAYEEALFARALADDAPELAFRARVGASLRTLDARGTLDVWLTARDVERVRASGLRTFFHEIDPAHPVAPQLPADAELVITRVPIDLAGVRALDVEVLSPDGRLLKRMPDVAFDPADGAIFACCEAELARTAAASQTITRLWATDDGGRRLVGELR